MTLLLQLNQVMTVKIQSLQTGTSVLKKKSQSVQKLTRLSGTVSRTLGEMLEVTELLVKDESEDLSRKTIGEKQLQHV